MYLLIFLLIIIIVIIYFRKSENFATSPGTLLQLAAKGPQDIYLTGLPYIDPHTYLDPLFYSTTRPINYRPIYYPPYWRRPLY